MKRFKKSTSITIALLIYVSATAAYFLPRNTVISDTEKYVTVAGHPISLCLSSGWCCVRKKTCSENVERKMKSTITPKTNK